MTKSEILARDKHIIDVVSGAVYDENGECINVKCNGSPHKWPQWEFTWCKYELFTPEFSWEKFKTQKIAVNCKSGEEAVRFLGLCKAVGINIGSFEGSTYWNFARDRTCYVLDTRTHRIIEYSPLEYYDEKGYTIIDSTTIPDLKYRPFRELKADLMNRVVKCRISGHLGVINHKGEARVMISGWSSRSIDAQELFEQFEFLDQKTGETSPCGEVDCDL